MTEWTLRELGAEISIAPDSGAQHTAALRFICPICKPGPSATPENPRAGVHSIRVCIGKILVRGFVWRIAAGDTIDTLTIEPSVDVHCESGRVHVVIQNGRLIQQSD